MESTFTSDRYFLITIDTEGDNLWGVTDIKEKIETKNAKYLFRFQELCEKYGFIPTYLTNYEMACDQAMIELGREGLRKGTLEIGSHEHAWNQPPYYSLLKSPFRHGKPYLGEYPIDVIKNKLESLTKTLEDTFGCAIVSHRGGRWCLDERIVGRLIDLGYIVDCTCTPGISWNDNPGWTIGGRGTDWSNYRNEAFYLHSDNGKLLEIPVSIDVIRGHNKLSWLRPNGNNTTEMLMLIDECKDKNNYLEFMIHSSELMPGGSPLMEKKWEINLLYESIEMIFKCISALGYKGIGLSDYARVAIDENKRIMK